MLSQVKGSRSVKKESSDYAWGAEYELRQTEVSNPYIKGMEFRIRAIRLAIVQNWVQLRETIDETNQHYLDFPYVVTNQSSLELLLHQLRLASNCMNFKKCEQILEEAYQKADYQAFDIFDFKSEEFDYCLRSGQFHRAAKVMKEVMEADQFSLLNPVDHAQWRVKEAFIYFLSKVDDELIDYVSTFKVSYSLTRFYARDSHLYPRINRGLICSF